MTYKEQLYYLLSEYIKGNYTTNDFCDQFGIIYNTKLDYDDLSNKEYDLFNKLTDITERFSPYEEDLKIPNVFKSETDVKDIAEKTYNALMN